MPTPGDVVDLDLEVSAAQCQHIRAVSTRSTAETRGNVGFALLTQLGETLAVILDLPGASEEARTGRGLRSPAYGHQSRLRRERRAGWCHRG